VERKKTGFYSVAESKKNIARESAANTDKVAFGSSMVCLSSSNSFRRKVFR